MTGTRAAVVALFDVDGTLVRTEGPSRHSRAFKAAFKKTYGSDCTFAVGMHGMTDLQIFMALSREMNLADGRAREMALEACRTMVELYHVADEADGGYVVLPGVVPLLQTLRERGAILGLVTGNVPEIAAHKLQVAGLGGFFPFGAFGSEGDERTVLPPLAVERAEAACGCQIDPSRVFIIGDTPRDVSCAVDNGYRSVAVATGHVPIDALKVTPAELVLPSLEDATPVLRLMGLE